jgi:hypothetical protein
MLTACMLGDRFAIVTFAPALAAWTATVTLLVLSTRLVRNSV